jgi:hypothetical protein
MKHAAVALNDAPGGNIVTTWNWNLWGFHNTVSSRHAFPGRNGSVRHFPCILVPGRPYPTANVFVIEPAQALIPGDERVSIVVGVRTELGNELQAHRHAIGFQFTCQDVGNPASCFQCISNPGHMGSVRIVSGEIAMVSAIVRSETFGSSWRIDQMAASTSCRHGLPARPSLPSSSLPR